MLDKHFQVFFFIFFLLRLHFSEQYFTLSQLFRHDFRHVMGLSQHAHIFDSFGLILVN